MGDNVKRILVIEDELDIQELLENFLKAEGYEVVLAGDGVEGILQFSKGSFDLVLLEDSGELISRFAAQNNVEVEVVDAQYNIVNIPGYTDSYMRDAAVQESVVVTTDTQSTDPDTIDYYFSTGFVVDSISSVDVSMGTSTSYPFSFADSDEPYSLIVISSMRPVNQAAQALVRILPLLVAAILLMSLLGSWFYSRYVTRPIVNISRISKKMSDLEFDWHCEATRSDEIGVLATSLNHLSKKLSAALDELKAANASLQADIDQERELERKRLAFFSAASHELKTPVTVVKGQLEGMLNNVGVYQDHNKYLKRSLEVTGRMEELVQELLAVSRICTTAVHVKQNG